MTINFFVDQNPFFVSSALANRYLTLLKGMMNNGIQVNMFVVGGYVNLKEIFFKYELQKQYPLLSVRYLIHVINSSLFLRRINTYVFNFIITKVADIRLKKAFLTDADYCWIAGSKSIRLAYLKYKSEIKSKSIIEFSEYQQLYLQDTTLPSFKRKRAEDSFNITCRVIKEVDNIIVMTKTLEKYYKTLATAKTTFLHLPMTVDLSRFNNLPTTDKYKSPYIAFTGTFSNAKDGVDILIKAFAKIANKYPSYMLLLAGFPSNDVIGQKKLISELGLNSRISYLGILNREEIPVFISNADLLVLPRPDSRQAQGGFPTKLGEYLATGKPVCVTRVGEVPNYLEDSISAFMAVPGDVDSFADAMDRSLSNLPYSTLVGAKGRKVAEENFSIDVQVKRLVEFLVYNK